MNGILARVGLVGSNSRAMGRAILLCVAAGTLFAWLRLPLPWMLGPLLAMAIGKSSGLALAAPPGSRQAGQLVIACALGLYFTPHIASEVITYLPWMLLSGVIAVLTGFVGSAISRSLMGTTASGEPALDRATAFFASVPGGAGEMAVLAERFGGRVDRVAFAQSFRILLVVICIPFIYRYADIHGLDQYTPVAGQAHAGSLAVLIGLALAGAFLFMRFRAPNAFFLGPLAVVVGLTASGVSSWAVPGWLSAAAQVCLGCALGAKFERDFFRAAPRFMFAVVVATVGAMAMALLYAWGLWQLAGIHPASGVLAVAPGGIAEMCITAKVMQLGVPLVTAFHVARVVLLVSFSGVVYRRFVA